LRYVVEKVEKKPLTKVDFKAVRGMDKIKEATLDVAGNKINVAVVYGLANAKKLAEKVVKGEANYHFIEVMACPGGCIAGAGQPITHNPEARKQRAQGIYNADKTMPLQKSQDNYMVEKCYRESLGGQPGSQEAHHLLHTYYQNRSQLFDARVSVLQGSAPTRLPIAVTICANQENCPGQKLLGLIVEYVKTNGYQDRVDIDATFSSRPSEDGTICVTVGDKIIDRCEFTNPVNTEENLRNHAAFDKVKKSIDAALK